ncbi:hypothetical protein EBZ38_15025 [bacterium]|nr:hypothetical protein [Alphaproteobacteria bacterium]NDD85572.1 hypothetical protein [bacterium]
MSKLNENIENFKCFVRVSHFTKRKEDETKFHKAYAFAVQSVAGKILTFHVMTDYGMVRSRVPISEIFMTIPKNDIPFHYKQLWDCFSENCSVITYDYLYEKRCQVILKDKSIVWATYLMTIDWYKNPYSDEPSDYKCGHILIGDDGYLLCQPNNRIVWKDMNWVTKDFPINKSEIKVDDELLSVEAMSDRWITEDNESFYYEINSSDKK